MFYRANNRFWSKFLYFLLFASLSQSLNAQDSLAVVKLYNSTNGENWVHNENWLTDAPLNEWYGITVADSEVVSIQLPLNHLEGELSAELGELSSLKILNLAQNKLHGSIPETINNLKKLEELNLSQNDFTDGFSVEIAKLLRLKSFNLSRNNFFGEIPKEIGKLKQLEVLDLSNNSFEGELPRELFRLQKLTKLDLHNNYFTGPLPRHLGNLIQLTYLDLSRNNFSGTIPKEIGKLINLTDKLALNHNHFSGEIPNEICSLFKLENLWLNNNQFDGILPFDIGKLTSIKSLFIYQNNLIGPIPKSIGSLRNLEIFYAQNNSFGGQIPNELWFLPNLKMLKIENNNFSGSIPGNLNILKSIQSIDLSNNRFDSISDSLALPISMLYYDLTNNRLFCDSLNEKDSLQNELNTQANGKIVGIFEQNCDDVITNILQVEPTHIDFENVATDTSGIRELIIINNSDTEEQAYLKNFNTNNYFIPDTLIHIGANDTVLVDITYSPINAELHNDVILLSKISTDQTQFVTVSGQGFESDLPERDSTIPWRFKLHPITFNDSTEAVIKYDIPKSSRADITVYNLGGRPVKKFFDGDIEVGYHELIWNFKSDKENEIEGGEYLVVMQAGMFIQIQPLLILY